MSKPDFSTLDRNNIVAFIGDIFERCGDEEYLGEPVTMEQHMLQGATIAEKNGLPEDIIVGALLPLGLHRLGLDPAHAGATIQARAPFHSTSHGM